MPRNTTKPDTPSRADAVLVARLAVGATQDEAAKAAGVSRSTVSRRVADPAFRRQVDDARAELVSQATGRAVDMLTEALSALRALLTCNNEAVRLGAVKAAVDYALRLREQGDLEARMADLEAELARREPVAGSERWAA